MKAVYHDWTNQLIDVEGEVRDIKSIAWADKYIITIELSPYRIIEEPDVGYFGGEDGFSIQTVRIEDAVGERERGISGSQNPNADASKAIKKRFRGRRLQRDKSVVEKANRQRSEINDEN